MIKILDTRAELPEGIEWHLAIAENVSVVVAHYNRRVHLVDHWYEHVDGQRFDNVCAAIWMHSSGVGNDWFFAEDLEALLKRVAEKAELYQMNTVKMQTEYGVKHTMYATWDEWFDETQKIS
jgi:hypothetical protein